MHLTTGVFWTDPQRAQIGIDPRVGVSLAGFDGPELQLVSSLTRPQTDAEIITRAKASGISRPRLREILGLLTKAGVLSADPPPRADAMAWLRIRGEAPDRRGVHVHIHRADYLGAGIALGLAQCGVGRITTNDDDAVTFYDHPQMRRMGVGASRSGALKTLLREENAHVITGGRSSAAPDLVVVTGTYATDPVTVGQYLAEHSPVYQAWIEEVDIYAGPLTVPHETACGNCLMLHRSDVDENWQTIIQQACASPPLLPETSTALLAISLATRDITAALDGDRTPEMWRVGPSPLPPEPLVLTPHPDCGCTCVEAPQ